MPDRFATTRWSLIVASANDDEHARGALEELCSAYWPPVYAYIRRRGHPPDEAADLTQAFFVQVLERRSFSRADPAKGRFRSYLLASAQNFLINDRQRNLAVRRGGSVRHESVELAAVERILTHDLGDAASSPHAAFERQWAITLMERALDRLREEYEARGRGPLFAQLQPFLTSHARQTPHADDIGATASRQPDATRAAIHRLRRRFAEALRVEISDTVGSIGDVDDELRHVLHVLGS